MSKVTYYPELESKLSFPKLEESIIRIWDENKTFEKSIENRRGADEFVFYGTIARAF